MGHFSTGRALGIMRRTAPFLFFRMAIYFGIAAAWVLATGTGAGIGWGVTAFGDPDTQLTGATWGGLVGFGLAGGALYLAREYLLYVVKAGHIAVMVADLTDRPLPEGQGQIAHARAVVTERFGTASALFAVDQLVKGVIQAVTGLIQGLLSILPIPGTGSAMAAVRGYLKVSVGLLDEVILAHAIRTRSDNPFASAREALVLYGQNAKPMLISAAWLTAIVWMLSFVVFLLMLAPAALVVWMMPGAWSAGGFVFALIFAWAVKAAVVEPFAIACLLQAFFTVTEGQVPNPDWEAKLEGASAKFQELGAKAASWVGVKPAASAAAQAAAADPA